MTDRPLPGTGALPLAARCAELNPSATSSLFSEVASLRQHGAEVLGLHVGEPEEPTPAHIIAAAQKSLAEGATRYTPTGGLPELREAICEDSKRLRGCAHTPDQVVVSVGAKQSLFNLALALFGPGDEVVVPSPCWVSYPDQLRLSGARPVVVSTVDTGYKLTPVALEQALTPATRGVILCSPNNPTGAGYSREELRALADVVAERELWVIVDEIYSQLTYDGFTQTSWLTAAPELRERTIIVDGVSKRFAMTGFRIGWLLGPARVARACETLQSQSTTSPASVTQYAALAALNGPAEPSGAMREALGRRRDRVLDALAPLAGVRFRKPDGAFYVFADVRARLTSPVCGEQIDDDVALARLLLHKERLAVVPGTAFLAPGHLRLSFAVDDNVLDRALDRLVRVLS